eukprot:356093-Chlamydomonas_euryale.AAC.8
MHRCRSLVMLVSISVGHEIPVDADGQEHGLAPLHPKGRGGWAGEVKILKILNSGSSIPGKKALAVPEPGARGRC